MSKKKCPECFREYAEKSGPRYRHFDPETGKSEWCRYHVPACPKSYAWDISEEEGCYCKCDGKKVID